MDGNTAIVIIAGMVCGLFAIGAVAEIFKAKYKKDDK